MRWLEATKGQLRASGIDPDDLPPTVIVLRDAFGNLEMFDVAVDKINPEKLVPRGWSLKREEPKMAKYFGDDGKIRIIDKEIVATFKKNHGKKGIKVVEALAGVFAELVDNSAMAFRLGKAFRQQGLLPLVFFQRAWRLIREGK